MEACNKDNGTRDPAAAFFATTLLLPIHHIHIHEVAERKTHGNSKKHEKLCMKILACT